LYENAIYGGRIDNEQDLRVLKAYLETYFTNNMLKGGKLPSSG
jgi:dynein heavy chain 2